ncbi:MAG TPA: hypothetical protein VN370_13610 [Desulfitobacteriaceae bacterium]|nr:hypothetical protein [Desulfitobacteriaceae bacterium]
MSHYIIREGNPDSEPVLISALNKYGDIPLAEAYLNCGNPLLESATREWVNSKNYDIFKRPVKSSAYWGSNP